MVFKSSCIIKMMNAVRTLKCWLSSYRGVNTLHISSVQLYWSELDELGVGQVRQARQIRLVRQIGHIGCWTRDVGQELDELDGLDVGRELDEVDDSEFNDGQAQQCYSKAQKNLRK
jgi:hypothetical protein